MSARTAISSLSLTLVLAFPGGAQDNLEDLEERASKAHGTEKMTLLNELSASFNNKDPEKEIFFARQALDLARGEGDQEGEARALFLMGCGFLDTNETAVAQDSFVQCGRLYESLGKTREQFDCIKNLGWVFENMGEYGDALEHYERAMAIAGEDGNEKGVAVAHQYIGIVYAYTSRLDQALDSFLEALRIQERLGDSVQIANMQNSIGTVYCELDDHEKGLLYYEKSLAIYREEGDLANAAIALANIGIAYENTHRAQQALEAYQESLGYAREVGDRMSEGRTLDNMAGTYVDLEEYGLALETYQKALEVWREVENQRYVGSTLSNIAEMYLFQKDYANSRRYLDESLSIGEEVGEAGARSSAYHIKAELDEAEGDFQAALQSFRKAVEIDGEILNEEKQSRIAELEARYENESKARQIELLEKNVEIQLLALSRARFRTFAILCGFALLVVLFLAVFRRYLHLLAFWKKRSFISHYRIERQIGSGGMGVVYQASDVTGEGGSVALKVIREEIAGDPAQRKRFLNEAYLVDQLSHPNIIRVFERGEHEQALYIAMELLEGRSLAEVIESGAQLPVSECSRIMYQLSDAVAQIHRQGIVHRDIKPENVMVLEQGGVKLLDFGLARAPNLTRLTQMGEILGTVTYLSPEQISRREVSPAGDVYALGVVFYELLTLEKPFLGENPGEIVRAILDSEPLEPSRFRSDLSRELNRLVLQMIAKEPAERPEAAEVGRRLEG